MGLFSKSKTTEDIMLDHLKINIPLIPPPIAFQEMKAVLSQSIIFDRDGDNESRDALLNVLKSKVETYLKSKNVIKPPTTLKPEMVELYEKELAKYNNSKGR